MHAISNLDGELKRALGGDKAAFERLCGGIRPLLLILASASIGRRLQAKVCGEDIAQNTLLQVARTFVQFKGETFPEFMAWVRRVLASRVASEVRRWRTEMRDVRLELSLVEEMDATSRTLAALVPQHPGDSPRTELLRQEELLMVTRALSELMPHYREVVMLRDIEGLSWEEIATHLGRTPEAARQLWARARKRLAEQFEDLP